MKRLWITILIMIIPLPVLAGTVNLTWDDLNNDPALVSGYRVYYGKMSHASIENPDDLVSPAPYENRIEVTAPPVSIQLAPGNYWFRVTVYGMVDGVEAGSPFSNEVMGQLGFATITISLPTITYP